MHDKFEEPTIHDGDKKCMIYFENCEGRDSVFSKVKLEFFQVVYLRDEVSELDYVVLSPEWLGTHVLGNLLSAEFLSRCHMNGCYSIDDFAPIYPEIADPADLLRILDTLQLCAPTDSDGEAEFEFPAFNILDPPK